MERKKGVMKRRGWALRLIWRDDGRRELGGRMERRGGNNLCWLTSPRWPCRRGHGSLHLPEIISLTHTLTHTITRTHLPQNGKKKGLMIFQHVHTNSQNPSLQFFCRSPGVPVCVYAYLTLKIESGFVCLQVSVYYVGVCHVWGTICSPQICFHP